MYACRMLDEQRGAFSGVDVAVLSCGTDGQDGPTPAAGAVATCGTWQRAINQGLQPEQHLNDNDSYAFWAQLDGGAHHIAPGLTGTNVMDVVVVVLEPKQQQPKQQQQQQQQQQQ